MKSARPRFIDTTFGWISVNIVGAIGICIGLNTAFINLAGVWARPDFPQGDLGAQVAAIVTLIDRMPPADRPRLAAAATTQRIAVRWRTGDMPLATISRGFEGCQRIRDLLDRPHAKIFVQTPRDISSTDHAPADYRLAVDLSDGSWVVFATPTRLWGLDQTTRWLLIALFVLVSTLTVALIASRRLARPMQQMARATQRFSTDIRVQVMQPAGPREFRGVIVAFNVMQERIQRFVTDRNDMLTAISHDLRAPLTRLRLRSEFVDAPDQRRRMFRDIDEMQHMLDSALRFFRDETDPEPPTRLDIAALLDTVIEDYPADAPITVDSPAHRIGYGRPLALRRALVNIIDNALKYGQCAQITLNHSGDDIRLTIDDLGPGIPIERQEAVFRPFFRLENSRNRRTGGIGLGLGTARSILRAHGGDLTLENRTPAGLRVTLLLPPPP